MVGVTRFELVASSVSGKRSPPELNARSVLTFISERYISRLGQHVKGLISLCEERVMLQQNKSKKLLHGFLLSANITIRDADMAQLVEHHLAKVGVAGSNPVVRSRMLEGRSFQAGLFPSKC